MPNFTTPPPQPQTALLSFPAPHVILVTLNRPRELNCINAQGNTELDALWQWMDEEPSLRVGILTGQGRAFCAGADLKGIHLLIPNTSPMKLKNLKRTERSTRYYNNWLNISANTLQNGIPAPATTKPA